MDVSSLGAWYLLRLLRCRPSDHVRGLFRGHTLHDIAGYDVACNQVTGLTNMYMLLQVRPKTFRNSSVGKHVVKRPPH